MPEKWPEITLYTTIEELKEIHRRIWDECIEEYEGKLKPETPYTGDSVACEMACLRFKSNGTLMCLNCPMFDIDSVCSLDGSLFERWYYAVDPLERKILAQQIRDYKWREETDD